MAILPMILSGTNVIRQQLMLAALSKLEGRISQSAVQRGLLSKYYLFQIVNVLFGKILGGGIIAVCISRCPLCSDRRYT